VLRNRDDQRLRGLCQVSAVGNESSSSAGLKFGIHSVHGTRVLGPCSRPEDTGIVCTELYKCGYCAKEM